MIECSLIFIYGITNTWLERQGTHYGDPFTTRQIQHISIAVMFWFGGLVGIALESTWIRGVLSSVRNGEEDEGDEPTMNTSFNPFPALIIAVTGSAMAAHHQFYVYSVQVHELWGFFLVAAAVLRCLTYIMLWLRENVSGSGAEREGTRRKEAFEPSRPPTEALAALLFTCGGVVFMASIEEVVFASIRSGHGQFVLIFSSPSEMLIVLSRRRDDAPQCRRVSRVHHLLLVHCHARCQRLGPQANGDAEA